MSTDPKKISPRIEGAHTGTIYVRALPDPFKIKIKMWDGAAVRQEYALRVQGTIDEEGGQYNQIVYNDRLTKEDMDKGELEIALGKSLLRKFVDQRNLLLYFSANIGGVQVPFRQTRQMLKHDHTHLTDFSTGQLEGWSLGPDVDPADVTFEELEGKKCLFYKVDNRIKRKVILHRTFNLIQGKRYMLDVGIFALPDPQLKSVVLILKEGTRSSYWHYNNHHGRSFPMSLGITARSASATLELLTSDTVSANCSFVIVSIGLSEFNDLRWWDPEWDIEWEPEDDHPIKEPQSDSPDT
jgi:hypothetical protein